MNARRQEGPFPGGGRYNAFGAFLKEKFGCRVYKVSVDAGFSCPNRDGTVGVGGCTYCNNESFRPGTANSLKSIPVQVRTGSLYLKRRYRAQKFIVYFQPFTNTFGSLESLIPLYESALNQPDVIGLTVGTRPDCVDEPKIAWFEQLARTRFVTIEYGLESVNDRTLERVNRGHDFGCWQRAVDRTRGRGIYVCGHLILGFPWEGRDEALAAADVLSGSGLDFLKLHHLHVVEGTALAREYLAKPFPVLGYSEYVELVVDFLERLHPEIRLERLFGSAPEGRIIAPRWGKTKAEIQYDIERRLVERDTWQGRCRGSIRDSGFGNRD